MIPKTPPVTMVVVGLCILVFLAMMVFSFCEGPPTANGKPGIHHVLARTFKDIYPRYKTMRGYHAPRKGGWDTHGLPVEHEIEKQLGIFDKKEIQA